MEEDRQNVAGRTGTGRETKPGGGSEEGGRAKERSLKERRGKVEEERGEQRHHRTCGEEKKMSGRVAKGEKSEKK